MAYFFSSCEWTNIDKVPLFKVKHIFFFKKKTFSSTVIEWNKLDTILRNETSFQSLQKTLNNFLGH